MSFLSQLKSIFVFSQRSALNSTRRAAAALTAAASIAALSSCAIGDGDPYARVEPSFSAFIEFHEEDLDENGWLSLEDGGSLKIESASLSIAQIRVLASSSGSGVTAFDPANPPEGYTLCHGGHCHAADGSLKTYAEIEAELLGSEAAAISTALTLTAKSTVDLLSEDAVELICPEDVRGKCALDEVSLQRVELAADALDVSGLFKASPEAAPVQVSLHAALDPEAEGLFAHALDFTAKRDGKKTFSLDLTLEISCDIFGELDWNSSDPELHGFLHEFSESGFHLGAEDHDHDHDHDHEHEHDHDHDHSDASEDEHV